MMLEIDAALQQRLETMAQNTNRSASALAAEAIAAYVDLHGWQVEQIERAVRSAEVGHFVSDEAVEKAFARMTQG